MIESRFESSPQENEELKPKNHKLLHKLIKTLTRQKIDQNQVRKSKFQ